MKLNQTNQANQTKNPYVTLMAFTFYQEIDTRKMYIYNLDDVRK